MPARKRKTSLNNVTSFIKNLSNPDTLKELISILSARLDHVSSSGSSNSEVESDVTIDNPNDSADDVFHDTTNDNIPSSSISASKNVTEMLQISSDAISNNISGDQNDPLPVNNNNVNVRNKTVGDTSTVTITTQNCEGVNLLNVSGKETECYDHHSNNFISTEFSTEMMDYFSVNDNLCTKEGGRRVANFGLPYHYNGSRGSKRYVPFPVIIQQLIDAVKEKFPSCNSNNASVNILDGPQSYLPNHSDNEAVIKKGSMIYTVIFGNGRPVTFSNISDNSEVRLDTSNGCIYIMSAASQSSWRHRIDVDNLFAGRRVSITLRELEDVTGESMHDGGIQHIIIGDSLMRGIKTDESSLTVRKGGAKIKDIKPLLEKTIADRKISESVIRNLKSVTLCVGTNNLSSLNVPLYKILVEYNDLLEYLKQRFPNCKIGLFNVPPRFYPNIHLLARIRAFNNSLFDLSFFDNLELIQVFWEFIDQYGFMVSKFYKNDFLHFSSAGELMVKDFIHEFQITSVKSHSR